MDMATFLSLLQQHAQEHHRNHTPTRAQVAERREMKKMGFKIDGYVRRGNYHNVFQNFLAQWADDFALVGLKEYKISGGYLDMMWQTKHGENIIAFEIDTSNRLKSIRKLLAVDAQYRIWICSAPKFKKEKFKVLGEVTADRITHGEKEIICMFI